MSLSSSVPHWPPTPSPPCCSLLGSRPPLCTLPSLSAPPPPTTAQPLPAHLPPVSTFLRAFPHGRKHQLSRMSRENQVLLSKARVRDHTQASAWRGFQRLPEAPALPQQFSPSLPPSGLLLSTVFGHSVASRPPSAPIRNCRVPMRAPSQLVTLTQSRHI